MEEDIAKENKNENKKKVVSSSQSLPIMKDSLEACHVAVNILNELLIYDRIEEGEFHLDRKEVAIGGVMEAALKLFDVQVCLNPAYFILFYFIFILKHAIVAASPILNLYSMY